MLLKIISICISTAVLSACGPMGLFEHKRSRPKQQSAPTNATYEKPEKPLSTCQSQFRSYEDGSYRLYIEKPIYVNFHREKQRFLRYNCEGKLYRDKVETVVAPVERFELKPKQKMNWVNSVRLFNLESCATGAADLGVTNFLNNKIIAMNPVRGLGNGQISIRGDESPGYFNFLMNKGLNRIYYTYFTDCSSLEINNNHVGHVEACEKAGRTYSGVFNVYVNYTEVLRPGVVTTRDECPKPEAKN